MINLAATAIALKGMPTGPSVCSVAIIVAAIIIADVDPLPAIPAPAPIPVRRGVVRAHTREVMSGRAWLLIARECALQEQVE